MLTERQEPHAEPPEDEPDANRAMSAVAEDGHLDVGQVFDYAPEARCLLSPSFRIQRASHKMLSIWKLAAQDCAGHHIGSFLRRERYLHGEKEQNKLQKSLDRAVRKRTVQVLHSYDLHDTTLSSSSSSSPPPSSPSSSPPSSPPSSPSPPTAPAADARPGSTPWVLRIHPIFRGDQLLAVLLEWLADSTTTHHHQPPQPPPPSSPQKTAASPERHSRRRYLQEICPSFPSRNGNPRSELSVDEAFSLLVQSVREYAIVLLDVHGHIATWNEGARLHKGYTHDEVLGRPMALFYGPDEVAEGKPDQALRDCLRDGRVETEGWRYRKDGTRFWANVTITTVYKHGIHVGFGKVTRNLTECREAELRVVAAYEEANQLKSAFLARMSHEIRTPLHGMLSACGLLLASRPALTAEQRETARIIEASGRVLLGVIHDILDYAKLASGHFSIHTDVVGIASLLASVVHHAQAHLARPGVRVQLAVADTLPRALQGDPQRYRQVVENIVGNAAKFTEHGSIRVSAAVDSEDDDECVVRTEVADTGIGIPCPPPPPDSGDQHHHRHHYHHHHHDDLFAPFARHDDNHSPSTLFTHSRFPGVGLGLAISKSVVELMGGQIGFRPNAAASPSSLSGGGSIFWFTTRFRKIKSLAQLRRASSEQHVWWRRSPNLWKSTAKPAMPGLHRHPTTASAASTASSVSSASSSSTSTKEEDSSSSSTSTKEEGTDAPSSAETTPASSPSEQSDWGARGEAIRRELRASLEKYQRERPPAPDDAAADALDREDAGSGEDAVARLRARAPTKRVLIAEDNAINQRVLVGMLRLLGFDPARLVLVANGAEAVARARSEPAGFFDLVLMDINMPVLDGHGATRQLRAAGCAVPIVAMTAYALQGDEEQCLALGMDGYLSKPVDKRKLVATLLAWLPEQERDEQR